MSVTWFPAEGWEAVFRHEGHHTSHEVIFWCGNEDGITGYIDASEATRNERGFVSATRFQNFAHYRKRDRLTIIPAQPGWWVVHRDSEAPETGYWFAVIAWCIDPDGYDAQPVTAPDSNGMTGPDDLTSGRVRVVFDPARQVEGAGAWPGEDDG